MISYARYCRYHQMSMSRIRTNSNSKFHKMIVFLQNATVISKCSNCITKCDFSYKMRRYKDLIQNYLQKNTIFLDAIQY